MNPSQLVDEAKNKLTQSKNHLEVELKKLRTGRAHPSMLDGVSVKAYGSVMPINQVGNVTAPEAQLIQITPFDPNNIQAISEAIRNDQSLGLNPADDGRVVRVPIPPLTTERRMQIVKQLNEKIEESHIASRNIRHDILTLAKNAKSSKQISEDDFTRIEKQIDELMAKTRTDIEQIAKIKELEIMKV